MNKKKVFIICTAVFIVAVATIIGWFLGKKNLYYFVTFNSDNVIYKQEKVKKGKTVEKPLDPEKEGYVFIEWQLDGILYDFSLPIEKNILLTAKWETKNMDVETIVIKWDTDGGTTLSNQIIERGSFIAQPLDPKKEGYIFKYWAIDGEKFDFNHALDEDTTIKAVWEKTSSNTDSGTSGNVSNNNSSVSSNSNNNTVSNNSSEEVYIKKYTVIFSSNGGTNVPVQHVEEGKKIVKPTNPTREGYEFVAWRENIDGEDYNFNNKVNRDIILNAVWREIQRETHTVSFNTNTESYILSPVRVSDGDTVPIPHEITKTDYKFIEWQLDGVKYDFNVPVTRDITLVAKWLYKPFVFTINNFCEKDSILDEFDGSMIEIYEGARTGGKYCECYKNITIKGKMPGTTHLTVTKYSINEIMGNQRYISAKYEYELNIDNDLVVTVISGGQIY